MGMSRIYDVAILGCNPGAYAAGGYLAGKGFSVVVLGVPGQEVESPLCDWVPGDFFALKELPKSLPRSCGAQAFARVHYHNATLTTEAQSAGKSPLGYLLKPGELLKALKTAATKTGATFRACESSPKILLEDDGVRLHAPAALRSKLLLVTHGLPAGAINELALPVRTLPTSSLTVVGLDVPVKSGSITKEFASALHVVEAPERSELGLFFVLDGLLHLRLISHSKASGNRAAELAQMFQKLQAAGILPKDLPLEKARGGLWHPPAGAALEVENHIAKRCILAGTAGGFAESITGQTIAPSVRSSILAAQAAEAALKGKNLQEGLVRFRDAWRKSLASCLRPPATSLAMLLPLLFVNQRIANRFTRSLLYGETL
jgi:flavin-dependent dehydrogenase